MSNISLTFTKIDYIQEHAHVFVPYLVLNFFGMILGTIGK